MGRERKDMVSFFGVFLASTNCLFFEEGKKKINNKIDQKQNLFQHHFFPSSIKVFFPCFWVFFVFSLPMMMMMKEPFFANLFQRLCFKHNAGKPPRDRRATDAAASKRAPMYSRHIPAFDTRV